MLAEPDPVRQLRRTAAASRGEAVHRRVAPAIVIELDPKGALKPDLDIDRATDILWTLNHPDVWHLFTGLRGWTPDEYEQWFWDGACAQLLRT